jgi:hypothetical protein
VEAPAADSTWLVKQGELLSGPGAADFKKYMADKGLDLTEDSLYELYKNGRSGDFPEALSMLENALGQRTLNKLRLWKLRLLKHLMVRQ